MQMKLVLALGLSLSFLASATSFAVPLTAQPANKQDNQIFYREPQPEPQSNPFHHHGYLRSNSHLLSSNKHSSNNFLLGVEAGYANQRKQMHMNFTSLPVHWTDLGFPALPTPPFPVADPLLNPGIPNGFFINHEETITDNGTLLGVLAGWQWRCRRLMLGLEGNVDFGSYEQNRQFAFTETATPFVFGLPGGVSYVSTALYQRGPIYSLSVRGGYFVTPFFFPYIRVGGQVSRDEASFQTFILSTPNAPLPATVSFIPDAVSNNKTTVTGGLFGIGAEFPTYIGASTIRIEYNYTRTESVVIDDQAFPVIGNYTFRKPDTNTVKVAWVWNFI